MRFIIFMLLLFIAFTTVAFSTISRKQSLQNEFRNEMLQTFARLAAERNQEINQKQIKAKKKPFFTIVIDAGHGGKDSGALGIHGVKEKKVILAIAKQLAREINHDPHLKVILTRRGDYFVPLRQRLKIARNYKADLFIAVHADAYFNIHANGVSVFALSTHGATTEAARWLAERENYSELSGISLNALADNSQMLREVLIDLAQTESINDSLQLGKCILRSLAHVAPIHVSQVEQAPFVVLKSPDIPSILIETGFLSNPVEEEKLNNYFYRQQIAHAIYLGIKQYIQQYGAND